MLDAQSFGLEDGRVFSVHGSPDGMVGLREVPWLRGATQLWWRWSDQGCARWPREQIRCWGDDTYGQIGSQPSCPVTWTALPEPPKDSAEWPEFEPESRRSVTCSQPVPSLNARGASDLTDPMAEICALRDGALWCWGHLQGKLRPRCPRESLTIPPEKDATYICRAPRRMPGFDGIVRLVGDSCALDARGSLRCRVPDSDGELEERPTSFWSGIRSVALNWSRICVVLVDGDLQCTERQVGGAGHSGRLALGAPLRSLKIAAGATEVTAYEPPGDASFCALLKDRTVACWGDNYGDTPVAIPGVKDVVELKLGAGNACARTEAGAVYCWGVPVSNELGPVTPYVPVPPMPLVIPP